MLDLGEGLWPLLGRQILDQFNTPSSKVPGHRDVPHDAADDLSVQDEIIAASGEAMELVGHRAFIPEAPHSRIAAWETEPPSAAPDWVGPHTRNDGTRKEMRLPAWQTS
jgi:hypothetical protein